VGSKARGGLDPGQEGEMPYRIFAREFKNSKKFRPSAARGGTPPKPPWLPLWWSVSPISNLRQEFQFSVKICPHFGEGLNFRAHFLEFCVDLRRILWSKHCSETNSKNSKNLATPNCMYTAPTAVTVPLLILFILPFRTEIY
jgi:hypothetical protein